MKKILFKILVIFFLIISIFKTGAIGSFVNDFISFFLGDASLIVSLIVLLLLLFSFFNLNEFLEEKENKNKLIGSISLFFSIFLISTLIKLSSLFDTDIILDQSNFTSINLNDGIGLIQSFIVVLFHNLFGTFGVIMVSVIIILFSLYLILDVKAVFQKIKESKSNFSLDPIKGKLKKDEEE